jgi:hypothetical protein
MHAFYFEKCCPSLVRGRATDRMLTYKKYSSWCSVICGKMQCLAVKVFLHVVIKQHVFPLFGMVFLELSSRGRCKVAMAGLLVA